MIIRPLLKQRLVLAAISTLGCFVSVAQKQVSITIDDVPNTGLYANDAYACRLLQKIDSMKLPVAIFINEQGIFSADSSNRAIALFENWIRDPLVTVGNHGYSHAMYSSVGIEAFREDVLKGESISKTLAKRYGKQEAYYRFPYNDLGKDATQHREAEDFLKSRNYIVTPFTTHSDDWMVTELYAHYKNKGMKADAERVARTFIANTIDNFKYIESLTSQKLGRDVKQIYLMHDNLLNADYLDELVSALKKNGYTFITLDEAMKDPVYAQQDYYEQKFGISWVYRWMKDLNQRMNAMQKAPETETLVAELKAVLDAQKK